MTDTGAHQGVRSLLARFENNQNSSTSPPLQARSPVTSENLSRVRASFIAVDGGSPSNPIVGLKRISGISDGLPPPARVRSFNSEDLDGSVKSSVSSTLTTNGVDTAQKVAGLVGKENSAQESIESVAKQKQAEEITSSANKENHPASKSPTLGAPPLTAPKTTKTVSKRPSTVQIGKNASVNKPASQALVSKPSTQPRTPTSPTKPDSDKTSRNTRAPRPSVNKSTSNDSPKAPTHKPSRASLNTMAKFPTKPPRASTPAREPIKSASRASDVRSKSSTRPARLPTSTSTPSLAPAAKITGTATLSRKPSSLRNTGTGAHRRAITPTASSIRKQTSRSPPGQSGNDRPHSRSSNNSTKPVDEGFLARMMRPTASSANKAHDKLDVKSPPRPHVARAPRRVPSKLETRPSRPTKEKGVSDKSHEPKPRIAESTGKLSPKEKAAESELAQQSSPEPPASEALSISPSPSAVPAAAMEESTEETIVEEPIKASVQSRVEATESLSSDETGEPAPARPEEAVTESSVLPQVDEQVEQPAEPLVEPVPTNSGEQLPVPVAEVLDQSTEPASLENVEIIEQAEPTSETASAAPEGGPAEVSTDAVSEDIPEVVPVNTAEPASDTPLESASAQDSNSGEVDIEIDKLTLDDKHTTS